VNGVAFRLIPEFSQIQNALKVSCLFVIVISICKLYQVFSCQEFFYTCNFTLLRNISSNNIFSNKNNFSHVTHHGNNDNNNNIANLKDNNNLCYMKKWDCNLKP